MKSILSLAKGQEAVKWERTITSGPTADLGSSPINTGDPRLQLPDRTQIPLPPPQLPITPVNHGKGAALVPQLDTYTRTGLAQIKRFVDAVRSGLDFRFSNIRGFRETRSTKITSCRRMLTREKIRCGAAGLLLLASFAHEPTPDSPAKRRRNTMSRYDFGEQHRARPSHRSHATI